MPTQEKAVWTARGLMILRRVAWLVLLGMAIGWIIHRAGVAFARRQAPAGFVQGVVQGALMPIALPNLVVGKDVTIYAVNNTGRPYKIGYTLGVNTCGLIFFGFFFWRVRRLKMRSLP